MNPRLIAVLSEVKSLLHLDRFRRFGLPLALLLVIAVLCFVNLQQSKTITAQNKLIHTLFQDSLELSARRMQQVKPPTADFKKPELVVFPKTSADRPADTAADQ